MRWWNETFDALTDVMSVPAWVFVTLLITILVALGWYFWPRWLPSNWKLRDRGTRSRGGKRDGERGRRFRLGKMRWRLRWRRKRADAVESDDADELPPDELPDLPASVLALTADQLAEAGRYAEAVRERLRAIVRDLIERGLIPPSPGWTVTELARQAASTRPALGEPLDAAVDVFSRIWYGLLPATADDDRAMRAHAEATSRLLSQSLTAARGGA
jgi:hypothetical protein